MAKDEKSASKSRPMFTPARLALLVAGVVAAFAIGFAVSQSDSGPDETHIATEGTTADQVIAELEARAQADPDNASAWQKLGLAYLRLERYDDAASAYGKATAIDPGQAVLWSALGEALVLGSADEAIPARALDAFRKAIAIDKADPRARYFLGIQRDLDGDHAGAIEDWLALIADSPADAPWRADVAQTVRRAGKANGIDVEQRLAKLGVAVPNPGGAGSLPGPDAQQLAQGSQMSREQQLAMGAQMVDNLERRLAGDPRNVDGWIMLMRSRMVLEQPDQAREALNNAVAANPQDAARLNAQAAQLGIR